METGGPLPSPPSQSLPRPAPSCRVETVHVPLPTPLPTEGHCAARSLALNPSSISMSMRSLGLLFRIMGP